MGRSRTHPGGLKRLGIWTTGVACLFLVGAAGAAPAEWRGTQATQDGVLYVKNPAVPAETPSEIALEERWRIGGDTDDEDEFFGVLTHIDADDEGNVYLLDSQLHQVMIYSPDGEFIRAIGREGEGPGEFRRPRGLLLVPGGTVGVIQSRPGKIILLTPTGEPAGNHPVPPTDEDGTQFFSDGRLAGDQIVLGTQQFARRDNGFEITFRLIRVDQEGKETAVYYENTDSRNMANPVVDEKNPGGFGTLWRVGKDGRVYASSVFDAYRIDVWLPNGDRDRVIEREYKQRVRSAEEFESARDRLWVGMRGRGGRIEPEKKISKTDRDIFGIFPREDGSLWVVNSRGALDAPEDILATFDVFDEEGRFVQQVTLKGEGSLPGDGLHFVGNRLFVVTGLLSARAAMFGGGEASGASVAEETDEDLEPMAVICYDLGFQVHGMNR